ncbi:hypothetical protein ABT56_01010 [Photobacterium aquae]|uniref:Uncharacterized protein n=2 Tax=Photobacterium aquae TaxID=1195763 RepID=A0A0J1HCA9_9GAMM|nr:hypothetical protein ABT56_01010 [Photobacterium aquae]
MVSSITSASTQLSENVYSPDQGVICDKKAGFCADSYGISMEFTKEFLGQAAQDKMMAMVDKVGSSNFDTTRYSMSNKVYCDAEKQSCYTDRFSDTKAEAYNAILYPTQH